LSFLGREPAQEVALAEILRTLYREPIERVRVLLVLRSDYQPSLFDLGLPGLHAGVNWRETGPFREDAARAFLAGSGSELNLETLVRRASDLDEIWATSGAQAAGSHQQQA
jgi:hypothetical protein